MLLGGIRDWLLEDRCLPSGIKLPMPTVASIGAVLYNGVTGQYQKTITITNNSPTQTIYPFLEGQDTRWDLAKYAGTGAFDPFDPSTQEYRGYLGYAQSGTNYAGLPPNSSITITVPLVFWDSGRLIFSTDGTDQFQTYGAANPLATKGAPFYYFDTNTQAAFFGSIDQSNLKRLNFTPIYNSFSSTSPYTPTTNLWKSPVASGLFQNGQTFNVTGPGLPPAGEVIKIDNSTNHQNYIDLPTAATGAQQAKQYIFTCISPATISPTARYIQGGFKITSTLSGVTDGLVMWYHALNPNVPNNDAPYQLTEVTFRGTFYDPSINKGTGFAYFFDQSGNGNPKSSPFDGLKKDLADYDISFVDSINMPVAMEARNVPVPGTNPQPFGWVGSGQNLEDFQKALVAFSTTNQSGKNDNSLGKYFASMAYPSGRGYPSYVNIDPGNLKLPAGQNLFLNSIAVPGGVADIKYYKSFTDGSFIDQPLFALTNGGTGPSQLTMGSDKAHPSQGTNLGLRTTTDADRFSLGLIAQNFAAGFSYNVNYSGPMGRSGFAGTVVGIYKDGVVLDRNAPANPNFDLVYTFKLLQKDYAAGGIAGLWYSWAKYYADHMATPAKTFDGTITDNIITLKTPSQAMQLFPGMTVTDANGAGIPAGCVILYISADQKIHLSEKATGSPTSFKFALPVFDKATGSTAIAGFDPVNTPLVTWSLQNATQAQKDYALSFAQTVYVVMSAWSVSVTNPGIPAWDQLLVNIIGGNLSTDFLPHQDTNHDVKNTLTNMSKSALRGVPDYTSPLYSDPSQWYPDPARPAPGLTGLAYNAYNLDPFVWFIHDKLGLSAYAFALDDDVGNVEAGGATQVDISVGGLNGLLNKDPYSAAAQWGVVATQVPTAQEKSSQIGGPTNLMKTPTIVNQIHSFDYDHNRVGTLVNGPGVKMGTTVQFTDITMPVTKSDIILSNPLTSTFTNSPQYSFFGPLVFTGTVFGSGLFGNQIRLNSTDAVNTLQKLGPLTNIQVTGEGIDPNKTVTIKDLSNGIVTLSDNLDDKLVSNPGDYYAYTFGSPVVPLIRDPGFEWRSVQGSNNFNHGTQISIITKDWTFTDATGYAGIVANGGAYVGMMQLAPQGLQVGFVQRDSSISQTVTLAKGKYVLTISAAQRDFGQLPQSLDVQVDGKSWGTIRPTDTTYRQYSINFNVAATGTHTITFKGTQTSDSTVLIDQVACMVTTALTTSGPPSSGFFAAAAGSGSRVNVYDPATGTLRFSFLAFDPSFTGGVRVAVGDINGDGVSDIIVASGPGQAPLVKVIDGTKLNQLQANGEIADSALLAKFDAYSPLFPGGVNVAFGLGNNGVPELITGAGPGGGPQVLVIDGTRLNQLLPNGQIAPSALLGGFYAYSPFFSGGVNVAAGDVNGDGVIDIITGAGPGGGPHVKVIDGTMLNQLGSDGEPLPSALLASFYAYSPVFSGGVSVAFGEGVNGDPELITGAGAGGSPHVKVIDGTKLGILTGAEISDAALLGQFYAYDPAFTGGVRVAAADLNGDGVIDVLVGPGPGTPQTLKGVDGTKFNELLPSAEIADSALLDNFFAFGSSFTDGIFVGGG
jgi:hypothetical protein